MWNPNDFCDADSGFDYVFTKMNAIYGAAFENNWRNVDPGIVRQTWLEVCGRGLTYRPKMDYALTYLNPDRPPTALQFLNLLTAGPQIPDKPDFHIEQQKTQAELAEERRRGDEARRQIRDLVQKMRVPK